MMIEQTEDQSQAQTEDRIERSIDQSDRNLPKPYLLSGISNMLTSNAKSAIDHRRLLLQLVGGQAHRDFPVFDDDETVRQRSREILVLLDQKDRVSSVLQFKHEIEESIDDDRRQSLRNLIKQRIFAPVRKIRAIASICCSPPDNLVPCVFFRSARFGRSS